MQYQNDREEAIKRVPKNMDIIVSDFNKKITEAHSILSTVQTNLKSKLGMDEFNKQMSTKLNLAEFERWFPTK